MLNVVLGAIGQVGPPGPADGPGMSGPKGPQGTILSVAVFTNVQSRAVPKERKAFPDPEVIVLY